MRERFYNFLRGIDTDSLRRGLYRLGQSYYRFACKAAYRLSHRIFRCPGCNQKVRVPRGKGKIQITCPKCRNEFIRRS